MLQHPDNDHWHEWREAVERTGYTPQLARAARILEELENLSPSAFESFTEKLYRSDIPCLCFASTNIADEINYGTGKLDFNGFWEFPCTHRNL